MIVVLDNYDSFTYNLAQYLGELGADIEVARNDALTVEAVERMERDWTEVQARLRVVFAWL